MTYCTVLQTIIGVVIMDKDKVKTIVKIGGREYTMRGVDSEEHIHSVAICVNKKIAEITKNQPKLSTSLTIVMTAMNLADEVLKLNKKIEQLNEELESYKDSKKAQVAPIYDVSRKGRR